MLHLATESIVPLRAEASHRAEQVSQLLLFEPLEVLQTQDEWLHIRSLRDGYEGWCPAAMTAPAPPDWPAPDTNDWRHVIVPLTHIERVMNGNAPISTQCLQPVYAGTRLPASIVKKGSLVIGNNRYFGFTVYKKKQEQDEESEQDEENSAFTVALDFESMLTNAPKMLAAPYLWGGRTVAGIDCSGLVQTLYASMGISLPRDAWQQAQHAPLLTLQWGQQQAGDLIFFHNEEGRITHVGMMLNKTKILHASHRVRIDTLVPEGILNRESQTLSHKLHSIKRVVI